MSLEVALRLTSLHASWLGHSGNRTIVAEDPPSALKVQQENQPVFTSIEVKAQPWGALIEHSSVVCLSTVYNTITDLKSSIAIEDRLFICFREFGVVCFVGKVETAGAIQTVRMEGAS